MKGFTVIFLFVEKTMFSYQSTKTATKYTFIDENRQKYDLVDFNGSTLTDFESGSVYDVDCKLGEYVNKDGQKEPRILSISSCSLLKDYDCSIFFKKSKYDLNHIYSMLCHLVSNMSDEFVKKVAEKLLEHPDYKIAPAAKRVHNAWLGGLIEHAYALTRIAFPIVEHYRMYFPKISQDKVVFGCLFHDWGKVYEYNSKIQTYPFSTEGELNPHLTRASNEIYLIAESLKNEPFYDPKTRDELIHIVLSHHGKKEWGSPVEPKTLEALIVHHLDNLDSKVMHVHSLMENSKQSLKEFTEPSIDKIKYLRQEV